MASSETRSKIRTFFKKEKREENIERGRELVKEEAKRLGYAPKELMKEDRLEQVAQKLNILTEDDLLASLGYGGVALHGIMMKLIELYKKDVKEATSPDVSKLLSELKQSPGSVDRHRKSSHGVLVEGESGLLVRLARCCNPIPGDPITGYITRGRGVSVHRSDCPNVMNDADFSRMIEVNWDIDSEEEYTVEVEIVFPNFCSMAERSVSIRRKDEVPEESPRTST